MLSGGIKRSQPDDVIDLGSSDDEQNVAPSAPIAARAPTGKVPMGKAPEVRPTAPMPEGTGKTPSGKAPAGRSTAPTPEGTIDLSGEGEEDGIGLIIDLSDDANASAANADVIDLTADDASLAKQLQRAFNADILDLTVNDGTDESDLLLAHRNGIDRFLRERSMQYGFRVREIVHNEHSKPGTRLYDRFYAAYKKCKHDKSIKLVFHGTSEENIAAILEKSLDPSKRGVNGQALGSGEYFAEDPLISLPYCKGGRKMLIFAVIMDQSGLRKHNTQGILVCHRPAHHLPLAVVTLDGSPTDILARAGMQGPGLPIGLPMPPGFRGLPSGMGGFGLPSTMAAQIAAMMGRLPPPPAPRAVARKPAKVAKGRKKPKNR